MAAGCRGSRHGHGQGAEGAARGADPTRPGARRAPRGFSVLELILVVVLMGLLAAMAVPRLANSALASPQGEVSARNLAGTLRLARRMAVDNGALNTLGYRVECSKDSYRILDLGMGTYGATFKLADGWKFEPDGGAVTFNPYGGAQGASGVTTYLTIRKSSTEWWLVRFEPATGYVWCEKGG